MKTRIIATGLVFLLVCISYGQEPPPPIGSQTTSVANLMKKIYGIEDNMNSVNDSITELKDKTDTGFMNNEVQRLRNFESIKRNLREMKTQLWNRQEEQQKELNKKLDKLWNRQEEQQKELNKKLDKLWNRQEEQQKELNKKLDEQYYNLLITIIVINILFILIIRFIEKRKPIDDETTRIAKKLLEISKGRNKTNQT